MKKLNIVNVRDYQAFPLDDESLLQYGYYFSGEPFVAHDFVLLSIKEVHTLVPEVECISSLFAIVAIFNHSFYAKD